MKRPWLALITLLAMACGSHGPTSPSDGSPSGLPTGPAVLTESPIDAAFIFATSPLGKLGPPDHTLPTDHIYVTFVDAFSSSQQSVTCASHPIYAAGSGVVWFIISTEARGDTKVDVQMTRSFHYYYDHVSLLPGITIGTRVTAGQQIATTIGCPSFDIGTWDENATLSGLVNPARYGISTLHTVSPYKYFNEQLRSLYLSRSRLFEGVPYDREGRIDFGVAGRLIGDWFHSSLPVDSNSAGSANGWSKSMAFVPDWYDGTPRVSVGGTLARPFMGRLGANDPDPATVTVASGLVVYSVFLPGASEQYGWLLVQMSAADRIRVEFVAAPAPRPAAFSASAQEYLR